MADEDALRRSLGIARRRRPGEASDASDEAGGEAADDAGAAVETDGGMESAAPEASQPASPAPATATETAPADEAPAEERSSELGIKRRRPSSQQPAAAGGGAPPAGGGLGVKRRGGGAGGAGGAAAAPEAAAASEEQAATTATPPSPGLGADQAAVLLASYFRQRPDMREKLPPRVFSLKRTHGFYQGDGRPERKIFLGFEPALVLYVIPAFPGQPMEFTTPPNKKWDGFIPEMIDPGLHTQPAFLPDGYRVSGTHVAHARTGVLVDKDPADGLEPTEELRQTFNNPGEHYAYVAFKSDGQPLLPPEPVEEEEEKKRPVPAGGGLGIKRRSK